MDERLVLEPHPTNPHSRVRVLIGQDDGHEFRVQVPLRIRSVEQALDWLRPAGVPADALRQGEFFFVPSGNPHQIAGCDHPDWPIAYASECGSYETTNGGSWYRRDVAWSASFSPTHAAKVCRAVTKHGAVRFVGRRRVASHSFAARPRYFVRGSISHDEHGTLDLPAHSRGAWYEVIPNRVHGPFPVVGYGRYAD